MIINVSCNHNEKYCNVSNQFPKLDLDDDSGWEFSLVKFCGILTSNLGKSGIYSVATNLIDRDESNPKQVLGYFTLGRNTTYIELEPTHLLKYKLRLHDFSDVQFVFQDIRSGKVLDFQSAAVQIEIRETYGRF